MRVLIASDKFKGSLTSREVADGLEKGLRRVDPSIAVTRAMVADGGEGTIDAALTAGFDARPVAVPDPLDEGWFPARYARRGSTALVELAELAGPGRLPRPGPQPWDASTLGVGVAIRAAIEAGCTQVIVGVGGSCSTDGGSGLLVGLGARLLDATGHPVPLGARGLTLATGIDLTQVHLLTSGIRLVAATDVTNPLLGRHGAAYVFGPQKGAAPADLPLLDDALARWAGLIDTATGRCLRSAPGAGAAGGVGFALQSVFNAQVVSGVDWVLELIDFASLLTGVDLVVTGEGSLDEQSLSGKASVGVARAARSASIPVVAVCATNELSPDSWRTAGFDGVWALRDLEPDRRRSMEGAKTLIEALGERMLREYLDGGLA
ncbi:glycerate kinase [Jatrophihabitans sp. GAS493]|uniref:glycerate kinase n=1 Tax=Jatrophihabitans sp. GAS493 TaxID=1907575 RepID=UPI000BB83335|nr:glycerate kinase [Jatrophihabitans sp. GAS493]SOD73615.1 glycerate kinase [Jatrophihabitans sp. GAS493]